MALTINNQPEEDNIYLSGNKIYFKVTSNLSGNDNFTYKVEIFIKSVTGSYGDPIILLVPPIGTNGALELDLSDIYYSIDFAKFTNYTNYTAGNITNGVYQSYLQISEITSGGAATATTDFFIVDGKVDLNNVLAANNFDQHYVADPSQPSDKLWLTDAPDTIETNIVQLEFLTKEGLINGESFIPFSPYTNITDYDGQYDESDLSNAEFFSNDISGFFTLETSANGRGDFNSLGYSKIAYLPFSTIAYSSGFGDQILDITFQSSVPILDTINFPDFTGYRFLLVGGNLDKSQWTPIDEVFVTDGGTPSQVFTASSPSLPVNILSSFYYLGILYIARDIDDVPTDNPFAIEIDTISIEIERAGEYFVKFERPTTGSPAQYVRFGNSTKRNYIMTETTTTPLELTVVDNNLQPLGRTITAVKPCQKLRKADAVLIQFQNDYASTEYCTMYELEAETFLERLNIIKPLPANYNYQDRGSKTLTTNSSKSRTFVTDFITKDEADWMLQLVRSTSVGIVSEDLSGDNYVLPMVITTDRVTRMNDKLTPLYQLRVEMVEANTLSLR
jgi:hypothetical protein